MLMQHIKKSVESIFSWEKYTGATSLCQPYVSLRVAP